MEQFLTDIFEYLSKNYALYLVVVMGVIMAFIMVVLNFLKKPIKMLTSKISNERLRKLANKSIIILSFGMSVGVWYALQAIAPQYFTVNVSEILITGALPIVIYELSNGTIVVPKASSVLSTITDIVGDGKVTTEEVKQAVSSVAEITNADSTSAQATEVETTTESTTNETNAETPQTMEATAQKTAEEHLNELLSK